MTFKQKGVKEWLWASPEVQMEDRKCEYLPSSPGPSISEHLALSTHVLKSLELSITHSAAIHFSSLLLLPHNVAFLPSSLCRTHLLCRTHPLWCSWMLPSECMDVWLLPPDSYSRALTPRTKSFVLWFKGRGENQKWTPQSSLFFVTSNTYFYSKEKEGNKEREGGQKKKIKPLSTQQHKNPYISTTQK